MAQKLAQLKQQLAQIKNSPADTIDENFYSFMVKAKDSLGETSYLMAQFYFQYANFILQKQEANLDLFNQTPLPDTQQQQDQQQQQQGIPQGQEEGQQQRENQAQNVPKIQLQEQSIRDNEAQKDSAQVQVAEGQKQEKEAEADQQQNSQTYEDKEICAMNLELAINLLEEELVKIKSGNSDTNIDEVLNVLRRARTRLGDFYLIDENYTKTVEQYQKVIQSQSLRQGFECNRLISELYYLIGNSFLYENQQNCQIKAISQYIKAIKILLNHLKITLSYETNDFEIPTEEKRKVNRTHYMAAPGDSSSVIQIKNVISCLLDKIEHADNQISIRKTYEAQKQSKKEGDQSKQFEFKNQPQIMSFGSLSNLARKRMPQQEEIIELPFKESRVISSVPAFQKKQQQKKPQE